MTAEHRRFLIEFAKQRQRPGCGSGREFLLRRTAEVKWFDLTPVLSPLGWAVIGAVATRHYMPERMTKDLDIAILTADSAEVRSRLEASGFAYQSELSIGGSSWTAPDGTLVDVIEGGASWWHEALEQARSNRDQQGLPILPLQFLVFMKVQSGRMQDLADVTRMLGQASEESLGDIRRMFAKWAPADLDDLESLIALGRLEMES